MLLIFTALQVEANPLINALALTQDKQHRDYRVFVSEDIRLVVSGVGKASAASAIRSIFPYLDSVGDCAALNVGICGSALKKFKKGEIFNINKITDYASKKTFYLEAREQAGVLDADITTFDHVLNSGMICESDGISLVDMEASSFFESMIDRIPQGRIQLLKVVSDHLEKNINLGNKGITSLIECNMETIIMCINAQLALKE